MMRAIILLAALAASLSPQDSATLRNANYWRSCTATVTTNCNPRTDANGLLAASTIPAATVTITTSTPVSVSTTLNTAYYYNQHATAGTAITYNLPTAASGKQFCFGNSYNGTAANTGALTVATSAAGQYLIDEDGTLGSSGGNVASAGAGGDKACFVGVDATHWQIYVTKGTWTKS